MLAGRSSSAEALIAYAIGRSSVQDVGAMIAALRAAAAVEPTWSMTAIRMAEIDLQTRGGTAARRWLARSDGLDPHSIAAPVVRQRILLAEARVAHAAGDRSLAASRLRAAIALAPGADGALLDLAGFTGAAAAAETLLRRSLATRVWAGPLVNLGNLEKEANRLTAAIGRYRQAIAEDPANAMAWNNLATTLRDGAALPAALLGYRRALAADPAAAATESNLLQALQFDPTIDDLGLAAAHRRWGDRHATGAGSARRQFANRRDPDRPLAIGYVSADLGRHPVGFFLQPVIEAHDRGRVRSICYATRDLADEVTGAIRAACDTWVDASRLGDEALAERIRADGVDILVDLSGHTAHHRLQVFARRPAPVQATWLGYFDTCGLAAIDYLLTDAWEVPAERRGRFIEQVVTLPAGRFAYRPPAYAPSPASPPSLRSQRITFGSFNNLGKVTEPVIRLWSRVLIAVANSRLLLKWSSLADAGVAGSIEHRFAACGIPPDRLVLRGGSPHDVMLTEYGDIDVGLDPFPFSGCLTTVEALWMGVPVITLAGGRPVARQSAAILSRLGLNDFAVDGEDAYVLRAHALAEDIDLRTRLRSDLRRRMQASTLLDGRAVAASLEAAYREMWHRWCRDGAR